MRLDSRRVIAPIVFTLTVFTLVGYQKYRDPSFLSRASSLVRRRDAFVSVRPQDGGDGFPESPATERRSKPSVSGDLCEELVHSSRDHLRSIELLTRAQFPSAAREDEPDDSLNASASERFQCDDSGTTASSPKQLLDVFLFGGGEVDTLEIRLYELYDVVDAFIAVTSNVTHKGEPAFDALGPLLQTKRFERFRDKIKIFEPGKRVSRRRRQSIFNSRQKKSAPSRAISPKSTTTRRWLFLGTWTKYPREKTRGNWQIVRDAHFREISGFGSRTATWTTLFDRIFPRVTSRGRWAIPARRRRTV